MKQPHLDDEHLSGALDGEALDEIQLSHLGSCSVCATRRDELAGASRAVAAPVPPLKDGEIDAVVTAAIASGRVDPWQPSPADRKIRGGRPGRARTIARPPRGWLVAAAAGVALLAGLGGLLQTTGRHGDSTALQRAEGSGDDAAAGAAAEGDDAAAGAAAEGVDAGPEGADPSIVNRDLGDQSDPALLAAALAASIFDSTATAAPAGDAERPPEPARRRAGGDSQATTQALERAQCVSAARNIGEGRLGAHLSTATLRWKGEPSEVLVFALTEPAGGVTRQALVLRRPDCGLLADPRF